ncbi:MAG: hypothetical protein M5R36_01905 [Deltaproteobacteria bacterium]|nr:hypothetical protein [Deltaproteobacteria bacterium]
MARFSPDARSSDQSRVSPARVGHGGGERVVRKERTGVGRRFEIGRAVRGVDSVERFLNFLGDADRGIDLASRNRLEFGNDLRARRIVHDDGQLVVGDEKRHNAKFARHGFGHERDGFGVHGVGTQADEGNFELVREPPVDILTFNKPELDERFAQPDARAFLLFEGFFDILAADHLRFEENLAELLAV